MGLEAVKDEIIRQAKEQEAAILAEARKEANRIMKNVYNKINELREKSEAETKKTIESIKRQALAAGELEAKKMLLEAKKQLIDGVLSEVRSSLENLDDKKKEYYIKKLLDKAKKDLDIAYVYLNKKDLKFLREYDAKPADIIGGLIAENKEKNVRVDYSFETMLQIIKESEMQNINKILFG